MKKFASVILVLALMLSLSVPVFAVGPGDKVEVGFTYEVVEPKFMVEIPATIELELGINVPFPISVSNVAYLNGRKIVVSVEDALTGSSSWLPGGSTNLFIVENRDAPGDYYETLCYMVDHTSGVVPASLQKIFTEDGTKDFLFSLLSQSGIYSVDPALIYPNSRYTGWVVFGVKVVD